MDAMAVDNLRALPLSYNRLCLSILKIQLKIYPVPMRFRYRSTDGLVIAWVFRCARKRTNYFIGIEALRQIDQFGPIYSGRFL